jgi:hypothetical protein
MYAVQRCGKKKNISEGNRKMRTSMCQLSCSKNLHKDHGGDTVCMLVNPFHGEYHDYSCENEVGEEGLGYHPGQSREIV